MWSAGCILYLLLGGYLPFGHNETPSMANRILDGSFDFENESWAIVSQEAKDLICNLLKVDSNERWTAEEALNSDWFIKKCDRSLSTSDLSHSVEIINNLSPRGKPKASVHAVKFSNRMSIKKSL